MSKSTKTILAALCLAAAILVLAYAVYLLSLKNPDIGLLRLAALGFGGVVGIYLMYKRFRIGWWIFTLANIAAAIWVITDLKLGTAHQIWIHIGMSAVFLFFYKPMAKIGAFAMFMLRTGSVVALIKAISPLDRFVNNKVVNMMVGSVRHRPHPLSTAHNFVSWKGLTDKHWSARQVEAYPEFNKDENLPRIDEVEDLFKRPDEEKLCPKSTCLFPAFAQYLTDGFIRTRTDGTSAAHLKQNTSNHEIDLCPLYGLNETHTTALRVISENSADRGLLKFQIIDGEEFAPFLFGKNLKIKPEFKDLDEPLGLPELLRKSKDETKPLAYQQLHRDQILHLFAFGGDRANSATQTAMMNTVLLREHNRLAREIAGMNLSWSSDRVFETARNIVIVEYIKLVVNDYINHIAPIKYPLKADPKIAWKAPWNKPNWITVEFSLLYRWHALIPDRIRWGSHTYNSGETFMNNLPLVKNGLAQGFKDMASQSAGMIGPRNSHDALMFVERASIRHGRACELAPYKRYRELPRGATPLTSMEQISSDPETVKILNKVYDGDVGKVEFYPGIFCEDRVPNSPLPRTILTLVAVDAFSQALTNPLLSQHVYNADTFTDYGLGQIESLNSLEELVIRNISDASNLGPLSMTRSDWKYETV